MSYTYSVVYQPIRDLLTGNIHKYEALIRAEDNDGKIIYPDQLLKEGRYGEITKHLLEIVKKDIKNYNINISINISTKDILSNDLRGKIIKFIAEDGLAKKLTIELVEDEELVPQNEKKLETIKEFINKVRSKGIKVALDDFGKGYATFSPLLEYDFDIVKIDECLVHNIANDQKTFYLFDFLVDMFKRLRVELVAEHVEDDEVLELVKFVGIRYAQGYNKRLGKPQPISQYSGG